MKKFIFICILFCLPNVFVHASTFYFDPQEKVVGMDKPFVIALNFDSSTPVNTISVVLPIPLGFSPKNINTGNSIINSWIEEPQYDPNKRLVTFSGIIPGGFVGKGGRLILLTLQAEKKQIASIQVSESKSLVLLNDPNIVSDTIVTIPLTLTVSSLKNNLDVTTPDTLPPELFAPTLTRDVSLYNNSWVVIFKAEDKDSGVNRYEIQETHSRTSKTSLWKKAVSPYVLQDQDLQSYIFVKAVDENGNEVVSRIDAPYPLFWYESFYIWIILGITIFSIAYATKFLLKKKTLQ